MAEKLHLRGDLITILLTEDRHVEYAECLGAILLVVGRTNMQRDDESAGRDYSDCREGLAPRIAIGVGGNVL